MKQKSKPKSELTLNAKENELPPRPGGAYLSLNVRNNIAYVAIQFPILNDRFLYIGRLGREINTTKGKAAARLAAHNVLLQVQHYLGLQTIEGLNHLDIYYVKTGSWDDGPEVADGASQYFTEKLGIKGSHSRTIIGVQSLPRNFCVGIAASFTIKKKKFKRK